MLQVELEGHHPLWHPLLLHRLHHEDHGPADAPAEPLRLLPLGSLGPGEAQVSPGWTVVGSDAEAANPAPSGRVWVRGCVMERQPVTNAQYLAFLNELVQSGRAEEAWQHAPRERPALEGSEGTVLWAFDGQRYSLAPDPDGDLWEPDWPVIMVGWEQAQAYARWRAQQSGLPWRLPREDEWERGARGADGRCFPWGEHLDPTWACYRASHPAGRKPGPWPVGRPAADISPFGLWGMAGGVRQWCHNLWGADQGSYAEMPALRGGSWASHPQLCRSATRGWAGPSARSPFVGFRLARDLP
jgi:serine/threonine-protein kinase